ncbi:MAG: type II toxin-antitoxin system PemK/MazF family toxin [Candidatus Nomurabacteria bacterium]|jgi:mRNA interferase MazF|nr:type II toxin-antitoxin system PemK/MazF family toxin [Candidatus Nomurabacteria bacterium]
MKSYKIWTSLKKIINNKYSRVEGYHEREIYWTSVGENVGFEQDGKGDNFFRPVLIIKGFSKQLFLGLPLSTTERRGKYYFEFIAVNKNEVSVAILSQIRAFDTLRLANRYGEIGKEDFAELKKRLRKAIS